MRRRGTRYKAFRKATILSVVPSLLGGALLLFILWLKQLIGLFSPVGLILIIVGTLFFVIAGLGQHSSAILFFAGKTPDELERETTIRKFLLLGLVFISLGTVSIYLSVF